MVSGRRSVFQEYNKDVVACDGFLEVAGPELR